MNPELTLLMLAYYFPPRGGSGVQRSAKFAKYLPEFGINPTVITTALDDISATHDQSLADEIGDTEVIRVASRESMVKRLSSLRLGPFMSRFFRPDAHILWKKPVLEAVQARLSKRAFDAIYVSVQPWSAALIANELKRLLKIPLIVDFRDPWIDSTSKTWPSRRAFQNDQWLERLVVQNADAVISVTPGIIDRFETRYPAQKDKFHLIYNGFDAEDFDEVRRPANPNNKLCLGFAGRLYHARAHDDLGLGKRLQKRLEFRHCETDLTTHSIRYIVEAIHQLFLESPHLRKSFEFQLAGNIPNDNRVLVEKKGLSDVIRFRGMLSHSDAIELVGESDAAFLPMMTELDGRRSLNASGKIFEYLAQEKPILGLVPEGDAADIIRHSQCGWVVDPKSVENIKQLLKQLIVKKTSGDFEIDVNRDYIRGFNRKTQTGQLANVFRQVIGEQNPFLEMTRL